MPSQNRICPSVLLAALAQSRVTSAAVWTSESTPSVAAGASHCSARNPAATAPKLSAAMRRKSPAVCKAAIVAARATFSRAVCASQRLSTCGSSPAFTIMCSTATSASPPQKFIANAPYPAPSPSATKHPQACSGSRAAGDAISHPAPPVPPPSPLPAPARRRGWRRGRCCLRPRRCRREWRRRCGTSSWPCRFPDWRCAARA